MNKNKDIIRFCQLVQFINTKNNYLQKEKDNFYDGGHSFDECYSEDIFELGQKCCELEHILRVIG